MSKAPANMSALEQRAHDGIEALMMLAHQTATDAGWYRDPATGAPIERIFSQVVALMHSELSEALEADRKNLLDDKLVDRDGREVELVDFSIRILDTAGAQGRNIAAAVIELNALLGTLRLSDIRMALSLIYAAGIAQHLGLDLAGAAIDKNRLNKQRADHKLENRHAAGGKAY